MTVRYKILVSIKPLLIIHKHLPGKHTIYTPATVQDLKFSSKGSESLTLSLAARLAKNRPLYYFTLSNARLLYSVIKIIFLG